VHAQLATLVVASSSSILPWQHPTCITSNMPRHTKHNHAPGDHPHAATSVFNEATRESSVAPRTHTAQASCTFQSAALLFLGGLMVRLSSCRSCRWLARTARSLVPLCAPPATSSPLDRGYSRFAFAAQFLPHACCDSSRMWGRRPCGPGH
jgi:hypothetical protein